MVLQNLTHPPCDPLKFSSDNYLKWKMRFFLLALVLAKRIIELHGLPFHVWYLHGWRPCTFSFLPDFVAEPRILPYLTQGLKGLRFPPWMIFWVSIGMSCSSVPSGLFGGTWLVCNTFVLKFLLSSSLLAGERKECPKTPFHSGSGSSSTMLTLPPLNRIAGVFGSGYTRSERLPHHFLLS